MRHGFLILILLLTLLLFSVNIFAEIESDWLNEGEIQKTILNLHTKEFATWKGERRQNIIWGECNKQLRGDEAFRRSSEYATAISESLEDVRRRTGVKINPDHMVAILYRESSYNECVIGNQETNKLKKALGRDPTKREYIRHVKRWTKVFYNARKECRRKSYSEDVDCVDRVVAKTNPEYKGIRGWDLGAAQYRWPGPSFRHRPRSLVLPSGKIIDKVGLDDIFDYQTSVHMLAEDMVKYKSACKHHKHSLASRWGHKRRVKTEDAYYAHHHTGVGLWSPRYWQAVNRHLQVIDKSRAKRLIAKKDNNNKQIVDL